MSLINLAAETLFPAAAVANHLSLSQSNETCLLQSRFSDALLIETSNVSLCCHHPSARPECFSVQILTALKLYDHCCGHMIYLLFLLITKFAARYHHYICVGL